MKVIMHNSVSLDMSMKNLTVDLETHYSIVAKFNPDVYLFGSRTAVEAINKSSPEKTEDFKTPDKKPPYWVIVDSKGKLENLLHNYRNSKYAGPLIILVSEETPKSYIEYLEKRDYSYLMLGNEQVDYQRAFQILGEKYNVETIVIDSGGLLNSYLLQLKLIDEISLLINSRVTGEQHINLFRAVKTPIELELLKQEKIKDLLWIVYKIKY